MPRTDNMTTQNHDFNSSQGRPNTWPSISDPCPPAFAFRTPYLPKEQSHNSLCTVYPSPPSTSSPQKLTIPLPTLLSSLIQAGGVLDSPLIMRDSYLAHIPISPPPTIPTTNLALPDTDPDFSSVHDQPHQPPQSQMQDRLIDHLVADDVHDPASCSGDGPPPLSPLSPDWMSTRMSITPENSALLSKLPSACEPHKHRGDYELHDTPPMGSSELCCSPTDDDGPFLPSISQYGSASGSLWEPPAVPPTLPISPRTTPGSVDFYQLSQGRPHLPFLDIPESYDTLDQHVAATQTHSDPDPDPNPNIWTYDANEVTMDIDAPETFTPDPTPDLFPHPSPRSFCSLPDLGDIDLGPAPSSPSRRSVASLPELDMENDPFFSPPPSPTQRLLSLPGADTDDDLIPDFPAPAPGPPEPYFTVPSQGNSLLLIDDPNDVPPPRSPSPEYFDLDATLLDSCDDPDLQRLCELRRRAVAAERAARVAEAQTLAQGAVHMRAEARHVRKMEKERSHEIGTLLRLKLGPRAWAAEGRRSQKKSISSLSQLVARMMFRRHETFRPLANRRAAAVPRGYVRSSLSRCVYADGVYNSVGEVL